MVDKYGEKIVIYFIFQIMIISNEKKKWEIVDKVVTVGLISSRYYR